jgi:two-component system response regulator ResD
VDHHYDDPVAQVLVVEDDPTVAEVVVSYLVRAGHEATVLSDGKLAAEALGGPKAGGHELVVLDLMLPGMDGLEVCRRTRRIHPLLPIIMLTALGQEEDRITGLEIGADDYLTKPFSPRELVLRVESVLRRQHSAPAELGTLVLGPLVVDPKGRRASKNGVALTLTARELDLLVFLMSNPGQAFSRADLMAAVWGWTFGDQSTVTVHVRRLREKIEDVPQAPTLIQTVWGVGYRMDAA